MDINLLRELSIAYAQARLARRQCDSDKPHSEDELYDFVSDYQFAIKNIEKLQESCLGLSR